MTVPPPQSDIWKKYWDYVGRVAPEVRSPFDKYADWVLELAKNRRWLDAGCGRMSLPHWRMPELPAVLAQGTRAVGCDLDLAALKDRADQDAVCLSTLDDLPFKSASFDLVSCNMVFEHLASPEHSVAELTRVTAPGGSIIIHTVNRRHYAALIARLTPHTFHEWLMKRVEGRIAADVYPTLYRANTLERLTGLFKDRGARVARGGLTDGMPINVPNRFLFWPVIWMGLAEMKLAKLPVLKGMLRPNLLIEFRRD